MPQLKRCAFIFISCAFINKLVAGQYASSCMEFYQTDSSISSGENMIYQNGNSIKVYCSFEEEWIYTYISKESYNLSVDISKLYSTRDFAKLRILFSNGTQKEVIVENLSKFQKSSTLYFGYNSNTSYQGPQRVNADRMAPYLFLGFLPINLANKKTTQGYRAANHDLTFKNCDANPNSYITFYYNPNNTYPRKVGDKVSIGSNNIMTGWIDRSSALNSSKHMRNEFFFDFEMHMGGCGGFITSYFVNNITAALGLPVYAIVVTNATTSTFINEDSNDIGMVIGLVVGLVLVIFVLVVTVIFFRRCFVSSKLKESKDVYNRSQNVEMARRTGHLNNTNMDLQKITTDYPYQNLTNSEASGKKQDLKQTNLNYDYATVEPSNEQGHISEMISNNAASNNYLVLDPNITGYNRSENKTKTDQYELAQPVNTSQVKTSFENATYLADDTYGLSEEGVYDSSRDSRHKESTNNIYSHTVDTVYDSTSRYRSDLENPNPYDHFTGRKTEDEYYISKCS